jgi:hypothetical protein
MSNRDPYSDSPGPFGWFAPPKFTRVQGADIVMESITLRTPWAGQAGGRSWRNRLWVLKNSSREIRENKIVSGCPTNDLLSFPRHFLSPKSLLF